MFTLKVFLYVSATLLLSSPISLAFNPFNPMFPFPQPLPMPNIQMPILPMLPIPNLNGPLFGQNLMFQNIHPSASVDPSAQLNSFINIGPNDVIGPNSVIGSFASIGANTQIGQRTSLGTHTKIGDQVLIGNQVRLNSFVSVASNTVIADDTIQDQYSSIGQNVKILPRAYIGMFASIEPNAIISESVIIERFARIRGGMTVAPNAMVVHSPSSMELYQLCAPTISPQNANIASNIPPNGIPSPEFNGILLKMIDMEINMISRHCAQANMPTQSRLLPEIISLYLIQYHGIQRFNDIVQQMRQGSLGGPLLMQLQNERHFGCSIKQNILLPETYHKLLKMLTLEEDAVRFERVIGDTFCRVVQQLNTGERQIVCSD